VPVPNLIAWRDQTVGDMTSAFIFAIAPDPSAPDLSRQSSRCDNASYHGKRNREFDDIVAGIALGFVVLGGERLPLSRTLWDRQLEGDIVLLPLGSPLPDDAVSALRAESGMLGALSVPLSWGVAVPPDDYDPWAPEPEEGTEPDAVAVDGANSDAAAEDMNEWDEWREWSEWQAEAEPRFDMPRSSSVIPHSPAAG
jgi:hypothetical protein